MTSLLRPLGIVAVFIFATIGWAILGGVTSHRNDTQRHNLRNNVASLWGTPQTQHSPQLTFRWTTQEEKVTRVVENQSVKEVVDQVEEEHAQKVPADRTNIDVKLHSDMRRKGLMWYSLYDVDFVGRYDYVHAQDRSGELDLLFHLPDVQGIYDDFRVIVNGEDYAGELESGRVLVRLPVQPGERFAVEFGYRSRGLDEWRYAPPDGVGRLNNFALHMHTDFHDIDFPYQTLSPSKKTRTARGYDLDWEFAQLVSGYGVGMVMPTRIQPGELATELSVSAPVSLLFFFLVIFVLATLRGLDIHPINYLMLAGAFFAFHLLFAYLVDHVSVQVAFAVCSLTSIFLVVSYLRLVVDSRFAFREAALAQLVYLVGFSLAHFWEGFTGLTVTVLAIVTLFIVMQVTGRLNWSEVLPRAKPKSPALPPASTPT